MSDPWLSGLLVCPLAVDAQCVRAALKRQGIGVRGVPTGPAKAAWTWNDAERTFGLVVSGIGLDASRRSAGWWTMRTGAVALMSVGIGTGRVPAGTVVLDGDPELVDSATRGFNDPPPVRGRVAGVEELADTPEARQSLAQLGVAAADPELGPWRDAAHPARLPVLVARGLLDEPMLEAAGRRAVGAGNGEVTITRRLLTLVRSPGDLSAWTRWAAAGAPVREAAAACAIAGLMHGHVPARHDGRRG